MGGTRHSSWPGLRPIAALVFVALAVACFATFGLTIEAVVDMLACGVLVAVTVTDLERRIVPNRIIVPALVVALVVQTIRDPSVEWIVASLAAGGFYFLAALIYPAGLGMGDVKLAAFLGAWLGAPVIVALFAGSLARADPRRRDPRDARQGRPGRWGFPSLRSWPAVPSSRCSSAIRSWTAWLG